MKSIILQARFLFIHHAIHTLTIPLFRLLFTTTPFPFRQETLQLKFGVISLTLIQLYKISREINVDSFIKNQFLPDEYKERIKALNAV